MKGLWIAAAAALVLTPFKSTKDEANNETEYRSLLFKYTLKKSTNEDGTEKKTFDASFAGLPTKDDLNDLKNNVSKTVQEGVDSVKKAFSKDECCCHKDKENCCCHEEGEEQEEHKCCHHNESEQQEEHKCCCHSEEPAETTEEEKTE